MGTYGRLIVSLPDNTFMSAAVRGELQGTLRTLMSFYPATDPDKVEELLDQGDISVLSADVNSTLFYGRDRGESFASVGPKISKTLNKVPNADYYLLFIADDGWYLALNEGWQLWTKLDSIVELRSGKFQTPIKIDVQGRLL